MSAPPPATPPFLRFGGDAMSVVGQVRALAFAPGRPLVAALGNDASLSVWDVKTGTKAGFRQVPGMTLPVLAFLDDAHVLAYAGGQLVRLAIAGDAAPVPLAVGGLTARSLRDAVTRPDGKIALLHEEESGRTPILWRVDVAAGNAMALDTAFSPRELAAIGLEGVTRPAIRFNGAAIGEDGSVLALATVSSARGGSTVWTFLRWMPGGERLVPVRAGDGATFEPNSHVFFAEGLLLHPSGRWAIRAWSQPVLVDLGTGEVIRRFEAPDTLPAGSTGGAALLDGGKTLVAASESGLVSWDVATGAVRASRRFDKRCFVLGFAASQAHGAAAVGDDAAVAVHSLGDLAPLRSPVGHGNAITLVAVCPRGRRVASTDGRSLKMWHVPSGEPVWTRAASLGFVLQFSPDGSQLACTVDGTFQVLDAATGEALSKAPHAGGGSAAWTDEGRLVHLDYRELERGEELMLFEGPDRRELYRTRTTHLRCIPALSADGRRAIVHDETHAHGWDLPSRRRLWTREIDIVAVALSPDGERASYSEIASSEVRLLDLSTGRSLGSFAAEPLLYALAWNTHERLAVGGNDGAVTVRDAPSDSLSFGAVRLTGGHTSAVTALSWSRDGSLLVSGAKDGSVCLWKPGV